MRRRMHLHNIRSVIEQALLLSVQEIQFAGIADAALKKVSVSSEQLQHLASELEKHGHGEIRISAEIELFLRVSNTDVLSSIQWAAFWAKVNTEENELHALAIPETDWEFAWQRGIEPIKHDALEGMRRDVRDMNETLEEDSYSFQAAMVLFASELVGPYSDRIATFLGYPLGLVQLMAARLQEAKIWQDDHVHGESWFDPEKGAIAFMLDLMVAEGQLVRRWSEEKKQYSYHASDKTADSHFVV